MNPSSSSGGKTIGCIGNCTSGLSSTELDLITDNIQNTLIHFEGRNIFRKYLSQGQRKTDLACLDLYEQCCEYIDKEFSYRMNTSESSLESLKYDVNLALNAAEDLDGVSEIDLALLERYTEALDSQSRESLLDVLEETKSCLMNHLRQAYKGFRAYAMQPCPRSQR